jgi:hypothetical protein
MTIFLIALALICAALAFLLAMKASILAIDGHYEKAYNHKIIESTLICIAALCIIIEIIG